MATPDFVLTEEFSIYNGPQDSKVLKAGSFVRPISKCYLPKHITEDPHNQYIFDDRVFCYTHYGIILIPKKLLRQK